LKRAKAIAEFITIAVISDNSVDPVVEKTTKYIMAENMVNPVIMGRKKRKFSKTVSKAMRKACQEANFVRPIVCYYYQTYLNALFHATGKIAS
jgi:hypothetical protein